MRFIFESRLNEFIGLICYLANRTHSQREVPLGPVEKMVALALGPLGVKIPDVESTIGPRGAMVRYRHPGVIPGPTYFLRELRSNYFRHERRGQASFFHPTAQFETERSKLASHGYFDSYESAARALVELWQQIKYEGLMLLDMSHRGDGGLSLIVADLEFALRYIAIHLGYVQPSKVEPRADLSSLFENALDAYRDKKKAIAKGEAILERARNGCGSPKAHLLLAPLKATDSGSAVFKVADYLYDVIFELGRASFSKKSPEGGHHDLLLRMLSPLYGIDQASRFLSKLKSDDIFPPLYRLLLRYFRVLAASPREEEYENSTIATSKGTRPYSAACDLRGFSEALAETEYQYGTISAPHGLDWFQTTCNVVRSWWTIFDGALSSTAAQPGDEFFAAFRNGWQVVYSSAMAISHLHFLEASAVGGGATTNVKLGVGRAGPAHHVSGGPDLSTASNTLFHVTKDLVERKDLHDEHGSLLLAHSSMLEDIESLRSMVKKEIDSMTVILDHEAILTEMFSRFQNRQVG